MKNAYKKVQPTLKNARILYPDVLRIVAMFAVVLLHAAAETGFSKTIGSKVWHTANIFNSLSRWCVPTFLMISGMFMLDPERQLSIGRFYKKNVLKIVLIYLFWGCFYQILNGNRNVSIIQEVLNGNVQYHLYFLLYLLGLYVLVPILRVFVKAASRQDFHYFLLAWFAIFSVAPLLAQYLPVPFSTWLQNFPPKVNINFFMNYTGFFLFGYYIKKYPPGRRASIYLYIAGALGGLWTIVGTWILSVQNGYWVESFYVYSQPNVIALSLAVFVLIKRWVEQKNWTLRQIQWISKLSACTFGVYLCHDIALWLIFRSPMQLLTKISLPSPIFIPLITLLICVLSFSAVWLWQNVLSAVSMLILKPDAKCAKR
jgi:surface polysaccharide O-acyltransferase-like enzyme